MLLQSPYDLFHCIAANLVEDVGHLVRPKSETNR